MNQVTINPTDLVGIREIAEKLIARGLYGEGQIDNARSQVTTWISRREDKVGVSGRVMRKANGFPDPIVKLSATSVFLWPDVEKWLNDYYRRVR